MLTIERLDSGKILLPPHMLSIDLAEISYEESIFVAGLAGVMIDTIDPLLQSSPDELLGQIPAIVFHIRDLGMFKVVVN